MLTLSRFRRRRGGVLPALAASALAVTFASVAAASVAPAASATPIEQLCQWQALPLVNGWQSEQSTYGTGDPSYELCAGIVYLSGSLAQPGGGSQEFAVLPASSAPASDTYLSVYAYAGTSGVVLIEPDGAMLAYAGVNSSGTTADVTDFTSLAGVSFPAAGTATQPLAPLQNGWQSAQSQYLTGAPAYLLSGGIVHLSGSVTYTASPPADGFFAAIPAAIQPDNCTAANVYDWGGGEGQLNIWGNSDLPGLDGTPDSFLAESTGQEAGQAGQESTAFTSLAGVTYPAAGAAWQPLTLINGWSNDEDNCLTGTPSYDVSNGIVYLTGQIRQGSSTSCEFAVLPPAARPDHTLYLIANAEGLPYAVVVINPNGSICSYSNGQGSPSIASLGGIAYPQTT